MLSKFVGVLALAAVASVAAQSPDGAAAGPEQCATLVSLHALVCQKAAEARTTYLVCGGEGAEGMECPVSVPPLHSLQSLVVDKAHSEASCTEGETFGRAERGLWVKGGCVATFAATVGVDTERCDGLHQKITARGCQASLAEMQTCAAEVSAMCGDALKSDARGWKRGGGPPAPPPGAPGFGMPPTEPQRGFGGPGGEERHHGWRHHDGEGHHHEGHHEGHGPHGHGHRGEGMPPQGDGANRREGPGEHREGPGEHGRPHGDGHGHRCMAGRMYRWLTGEPRMCPLTRKLAHCVREHSEALSAPCRQTKVMQFLTAPPAGPGPLVLLLGLAAIAGFGAFIGLGLVYFLWQRKRLQGLRGPQAEKLGRWSTSLFTIDCASLLPSLLWPWAQGALAQADVHDRDGSVADLAVNCSSHSLISNAYLTRQAIRSKFDIPEEPVHDCLAAAFCLPCTLAQNRRELELRRSPEALLPNAVAGIPVEPKKGSDMI